jgi:osmotically inducible lipoprotein OsmB
MPGETAHHLDSTKQHHFPRIYRLISMQRENRRPAPLTSQLRSHILALEWFGRVWLLTSEWENDMIKWLAIALVALGTTACNSPGERAVGGALIGGATGAAIGGLVSGRGRGAVVGGLIGAAGGAAIGAGTAGPQCPYGAYQDYYGNVYCR